MKKIYSSTHNKTKRSWIENRQHELFLFTICWDNGKIIMEFSKNKWRNHDVKIGRKIEENTSLFLYLSYFIIIYILLLTIFIKIVWYLINFYYNIL